MRSVARSAIVAGMVLTTTALLNCSSHSRESSSSEVVDQTGAVGLQLQVGDVTVNSVHYVLTNGTNTLTGDINVTGAATLQIVIGSVPAGNNYTLTLTATEAADGGATCTGASMPFNVTASATATVGVELTCRRPRRTGSVLVNATTNECPSITSVTADLPVGSTIGLHVVAVDPDHGPQPLVVTWSGGNISDVHSANPTLTCSAAGLATLTVTASDGDPAADCVDTFSLTVACPSAAPATGAGGAGGAATGAGGTGGSAAGAGGSAAGAGGSAAGAGGSAAGAGGSAAGAGGSAAGAGGSAAGAGGSTGGSAGSSTGGSGGTGGAPETTLTILSGRSAACLQCVQANGCLDVAQLGGSCEDTAGTAPAACSSAIGATGSVSETKVCLAALKQIFTSACAATQQLTPCLCGTADAGLCLAGTATPNGPLLPIYQCELGATAPAISTAFTDQTKGAGQADALAQCAGAFTCPCF